MYPIKAVVSCSKAGNVAKINYNGEKIITAPWPTPISAILSAEEMLKEKVADYNLVVGH